MSEELYLEILLQEARSLTHRGVVPNATLIAEGRNASCGDALFFTMSLSDIVEEVRFEGTGCVLSLAAASILCARLKGKTREEVLAFTQEDMVTMLGVAVGPMRLRCVTLGLDTVQKGLCSTSHS